MQLPVWSRHLVCGSWHLHHLLLAVLAYTGRHHYQCTGWRHWNTWQEVGSAEANATWAATTKRLTPVT
jgi:hypothetical protein